jgi:hypothetical protein
MPRILKKKCPAPVTRLSDLRSNGKPSVLVQSRFSFLASFSKQAVDPSSDIGNIFFVALFCQSCGTPTEGTAFVGVG